MSIAQEAQDVYESELKAQLEADHRDKFVAIEPESGSFFWVTRLLKPLWRQNRLIPTANHLSSVLATTPRFTSELVLRDRHS